MKKLVQLYKLLNLLSLDVVAGAVISAVFFARIFHVFLLPVGLFALGLTVWIIYTTDHLLDARRASDTASSERHRFHQTYFRALAWTVVAGVAVGIVLIFALRAEVFKSGVVLAAAVGIYFLIQRYLGILKELSGALLYSAGVLLPALSLSGFSVDFFSGILILQFVITALSNLILFSWFDRANDIRDHHHSFATETGDLKTRFVLVLLFFLSGLLVILQLLADVNVFSIQLIIITMNLGLFVIFIFRKYFESNNLYRMFGETVFLVPIVYLWM